MAGGRTDVWMEKGKVETLLSLPSTPMALHSYVTFAAAALAHDGVGDNSSVWRWQLSRSG